MGFKEIFPRKAAADAPLKCSLGIDKSGYRSLRLSFSASGLKELGLGFGAKLRIMAGDGASAGTVMLAPADGGTFEIKKTMHKHGFVRFPAPDWTPAVKVKAQVCGYEIDDGDIYIVLPGALVAKPSGPGRAAKAPFGDGGTRGAGRNVTAQIMGDPPPGRSALDRKGGADA